MRILHVADFHSQWHWYDWLGLQAQRFDLVVIAGDLVDMLDDRSLQSPTDRVTAWVRSFSGRLAVCSGNHDVFLEQIDGGAYQMPQWIQRLRSERVMVDGDSVVVDSLRIEVVAWNAVPPLVDRTEILIAHSPPVGADTELPEDDPVGMGDYELSQRIQTHPHAPCVILGGHNHSPRRWYGPIKGPAGRTWSLVPGCRMKQPTPMHIIVDTDKRRATWVQESIEETISLPR